MKENAKEVHQANQTHAGAMLVKLALMTIFAQLATDGIYYIIARILGYLRSWEILVIAVGAGAVTAGIVWLTAKNKLRHPKSATGLAFFAVAIVTCAVGIMFLTPRAVKTWDFEDITDHDWGIYDEDRGRVIETPDVNRSQKFAKEGDWSLEVNDINIPTVSDKDRPGVKKWPAVRYKGGLSKAKVIASVYVPSNANFRYADVKFFLHDGRWVCQQSGTKVRSGEGASYLEGVILEPGRWVDLSWDLRPHKTHGWTSPWPVRDAFGIQVYVEDGTFTGPIYIDNVTIYK